MANYDSLTIEQLQATHADLEKQHAAVTAEFRACAKALSAKENEARVAAKIEGMSPQEREQFRAMLGV